MDGLRIFWGPCPPAVFIVRPEPDHGQRGDVCAELSRDSALKDPDEGRIPDFDVELDSFEPFET